MCEKVGYTVTKMDHRRDQIPLGRSPCCQYYIVYIRWLTWSSNSITLKIIIILNTSIIREQTNSEQNSSSIRGMRQLIDMKECVCVRACVCVCVRARA